MRIDTLLTQLETAQTAISDTATKTLDTILDFATWLDTQRAAAQNEANDYIQWDSKDRIVFQHEANLYTRALEKLSEVFAQNHTESNGKTD